MWIYEKRLQYPVNITKTDARIAKIIASQYGGPDCNTLQIAGNPYKMGLSGVFS
jgi:Mn-containing catalase